MPENSANITTQIQNFVPMSRINTKQIPELIGVSPFGTGYRPETQDVGINARPVMYLTPCMPEFMEGLSLFRLKPNWKTYLDNLEALGYSWKQQPLAIVYNMESFPSETFSNEYGQTFVSKMADVVSETASDLAQMTGAQTAGQIAGELTNALKRVGGAAGAMAGQFESIVTGLKSQYQAASADSPFLKNIGNLTNKLLAGQRIDFPAVWKNSSYAPSYSVTIKLYNPSPGSESITERSIIAPLAAILALACPSMTSVEGDTYGYPLFCKVRSNGLFSLEAGAITSIAVTKGGDQGLVAWNTRVGLVDVRIDFQNLYSTMLVGGSASSDRPIVKEYLETLKAGKEVRGIPSSSIEDRGGSPQTSYSYVPSPPTNKQTPTNTPRSDSRDVAISADLKAKSQKPGSNIPTR